MKELHRAPMFLTPIYKDYLWGGTKLIKSFNKKCDYEILAESWEVAANKNGDCQTNYGITLSELFNTLEYRESIFGTKTKNMTKFPILIKLLDAHKDLSIQVHPDNEYAHKYENDNGKNECWYIIDCKLNSKLICGLKDIDKPLAEILTSENIQKYLNYIEVNPGDLVYIPSGLVHALTSDITVIEVQENSDITYRIYDYDRLDKNGKKRELHIEKAIEVVNPELRTEKVISSTNKYEELINKDCFKLSKITVDEHGFEMQTNGTSFFAITVIDGNGNITYSNGKDYLEKGTSFIIPASLGNFVLNGSMVCIKVEL